VNKSGNQRAEKITLKSQNKRPTSMDRP
jgi:hypothetical protein